MALLGSVVVREPEPVITSHLFPELLDGLLGLLSSLSPEEWSAPIPRKVWSVRDVATHLLGGDFGYLSRQRDGFTGATATVGPRQTLVEALKVFNDTWVAAAQRLSPRLLCDLLRFTGGQVSEYVHALDPYALDEVVSWAGPNPAPNWLGIGKEYTERWHHHQHILAALRRPGFDGPRYLTPALAVFMRALPHTYRAVEASESIVIAVTISGPSGGRWLLMRQRQAWTLFVDDTEPATVEVIIPQDTAWKRFTRWISANDALRQSDIRGDATLARPVFDLIAVIA